MHIVAPAKINLTLRVLRRREDGFHEIETLMTPLALADSLEIEPRESGIALTCSDPSLPAGPENLAVRAAEVFFRETRIRAGAHIHLEKHIPHGAGLGGGSSDAASVLIALDEVFQTTLPTTRLAAMAAEIGSDVPFFLLRSAALCRGRGEITTPATAPALPLLLIKPPFGVPTPWAYKQWRDSLEIPGVPYAPQRFPWGELVNDLERPVFEKYLQLAALKRWLLAQPEAAGALMSGSGSTVFAVLRESAAAPALAAHIAEEFGFWTCATETTP